MFKIKVFSVGKTKEPWLNQALEEYEKRLKYNASIEWIFAKNDEELFTLCEKENFIALDPKGEQFTSEEFSKKLYLLGARATFVIGSAEGLTSEIKKKAKLLWSLSLLTFTHQITRLIFIEQIYRAIEIEKKSPYHK